MLKKLIALPAVALAAVAALTVVATPASAAATPPVKIVKVYYDSPGSDNRSNSSRNAEYVVLKNTTRATINLRSWTLRDKANHVYTFTSTFNLKAGATVTVHTGRGTNTTYHRYWGSGNYIWNNTGDTAYLRNASNRAVHTVSFNGSRDWMTF